MFNIYNKNSLLIKSKVTSLSFDKNKSRRIKGQKKIEEDFGMKFDKNSSINILLTKGIYGDSSGPSLSSVTMSI